MKPSLSFLFVLLLAGCVSVPSGPSAMALPGASKTFEQFRSDDAECRQYAYYQISGSEASQASINSGVGSAVLGTALGAAAGVAIGGNSQGTGVGAGIGLLLGSMVGSSNSQNATYGTQRQYANA